MGGKMAFDQLAGRHSRSTPEQSMRCDAETSARPVWPAPLPARRPRRHVHLSTSASKA